MVFRWAAGILKAELGLLGKIQKAEKVLIHYYAHTTMYDLNHGTTIPYHRELIQHR